MNLRKLAAVYSWLATMVAAAGCDGRNRAGMDTDIAQCRRKRVERDGTEAEGHQRPSRCHRDPPSVSSNLTPAARSAEWLRQLRAGHRRSSYVFEVFEVEGSYA
jgi:hypothetical protein